jgi:hypothetical protein
MCLAQHVSIAGEGQFPKRGFKCEERCRDVLIAEDDLLIGHPREEIGYRFADQPMPAMAEKVMNFAAEIGDNLGQENARFLAEFSDRRGKSVLTGLYVAFGETPVASMVEQ